jgi:phage-related baseplate assembly protein
MADDLKLANKDPATVLAEALAMYKEATKSAVNPNGTTLAPADPRRLHLQALLLIVTQLRGLIDFAGKQSLLRFVTDVWIDEFAALWEEQRLPATPSQCLERFLFPSGGSPSVPVGVRVTNNTDTWKVVEAISEVFSPDHYIECRVECITPGASSNGVAIGQIDTLVDPDQVPGCIGVSNSTETSKGHDREQLEDFRERLRDAPENNSPAGPRVAYEEKARKVSPTVADAIALGPEDTGDVVYYAPNPGEVIVLILKGERDDNTNALISVEPEPDDGLLDEVTAGLTAETERPLTDHVIVQPPLWHDFDAFATFYIPRSRAESAANIIVAANKAFADYLLWQQSKIGRDVNPSELIGRLMAAGAKRVEVASPAFTSLMRDQSARVVYGVLTYGGVEDD